MTERELAGAIRQFLSEFDATLSADLARIVQTPLPPRAAMLDFEVNFDSRGFRLVGFNMDRSAGQHGGNHYLLRNVELSWPEPIADAIDNDDEDMTVDHTILNELIAWLAKHWVGAGGNSLAFPAYACRHDDLKSYDLAAGVWIDDTDKWG